MASGMTGLYGGERATENDVPGAGLRDGLGEIRSNGRDCVLLELDEG